VIAIPVFDSGPQEGTRRRSARAFGKQIIAILKEHEAGVKTADLCRKSGKKMVTTAAKRQAIAIGMTVRYRSRTADDVQLRAQLRTLAHVADGSATVVCTYCCDGRASS
jgi:hypothetical protein